MTLEDIEKLPPAVSCANCRFEEKGECRRLPPQMVPYPWTNQHPITYLPTASWPQVSLQDWCGEFRRAMPKAQV